ncbi:hypothetical protein C5167_040983 [Papaver somniferum]|uniref:Reverse transcriptase zinc-binding domain-containing protein n=1 Tax=Papaver somniferum TaxID=3469 RepID=A0A4Y7IKQ7_PAPSO|nr:hypothetical protein C5167_040983 [Papaver somniferum]
MDIRFASWNKTVLPKISFLVWAAINRAVPTLSMLLRRGMQLGFAWAHPTTVLEFL